MTTYPLVKHRFTKKEAIEIGLVCFIKLIQENPKLADEPVVGLGSHFLEKAGWKPDQEVGARFNQFMLDKGGILEIEG